MRTLRTTGRGVYSVCNLTCERDSPACETVTFLESSNIPDKLCSSIWSRNSSYYFSYLSKMRLIWKVINDGHYEQFNMFLFVYAYIDIYSFIWFYTYVNFIWFLLS